ncbi:hypothetical protein D3C76_1638880 [compost metagenome]
MWFSSLSLSPRMPDAALWGGIKSAGLVGGIVRWDYRAGRMARGFGVCGRGVKEKVTGSFAVADESAAMNQFKSRTRSHE